MSDNKNYLYRIPLDDARAIRKVNYLDSLGVRFVARINHTKVGGRDTIDERAVAYYKTIDGKGQLPGLGNYLYSESWEKFPHDGRLEMRHGSGGGARIRGDRHVGNEMFRYVWVDFTSRFTPGDIKRIYDGKEVPDPNYSVRSEAPRIDADDAIQQLHDELHWAEEDALDELLDAYHADRRTALRTCDHGFGEYLERGYGGHDYWCGKCEFTFTRDELHDERPELLADEKRTAVEA
jgi:hypothetical protein